MKTQRRSRCAGALTILLVTCGLALAGMSSSASAGVYCNYLVPAYTVCGSNSGAASWGSNIASYPGGPGQTVGVCERTNRGATILSRTCANNWVWSSAAYGAGITVGYAGNNSAWTHTIRGETDIGVPLRMTGSGGRASVPDSARGKLAVLRSAGNGPVATITQPNDQVSLSASAERICLESTLTESGSCQKPAKAAAGELLSASICAPNLPASQIAVYGVVPDGVTAVDAVDASGVAIATATVESNTFRMALSTSSAATADRVQWVGASGSQSLGEIIPDDLSC